LGAFASYADERTRAIGLSHIMFHSGVRNDIEDISKARDGYDQPVVVLDITQSVGVVPLKLSALGRAVAASGCHKGLLVPHGLGFMYVPRSMKDMLPTYVAWASTWNTDAVVPIGEGTLRDDAQRFEVGNYNLAAIAALGAALEMLNMVGIQSVEEHVLALGDLLMAMVSDLGVTVLAPVDRLRRSHIYVLDLKDPGWIGFLATEGVRLSAVPDGIRISFGMYNRAADVERLCEIVSRGLRCFPGGRDHEGRSGLW
jgi:cysteine desulfurase / selenocysteine lyase